MDSMLDDSAVKLVENISGRAMDFVHNNIYKNYQDYSMDVQIHSVQKIAKAFIT